MTTKKRSGPSSGRASHRKHSVLGRRLIAGFKAMAAHMRSEIELPSYTVRVPKRVDVAAVRKRPRVKRNRRG